jgi:hypothetical protein
MGKLKIFPKTGDLESVTRLPSRGSRVTVDLLLMDVKSFNPPIDRMKSHVKLLSVDENSYLMFCPDDVCTWEMKCEKLCLANTKWRMNRS